jgi:hypothetical protein
MGGPVNQPRTKPIAKADCPGSSDRPCLVIRGFNTGSERDHIGAIDKDMGRDVGCHRLGKAVDGLAIVVRVVRIQNKVGCDHQHRLCVSSCRCIRIEIQDDFA